MSPEKTAPSRTDDGTAFAVTGAGEPLVLIHGVGMQQAVWAPQVQAFAATHQVITYDMLGHGASRLPTPGDTLAAYAAQLAALLDALRIPAANVAGHSMGALVALEFALNYPARTLRVAAVNAVFKRAPEQSAAVQARAATLVEEGVHATVDATMDRWFGKPIPPALQAAAGEVRGYMEQVNPQGYAHTYGIFACSDQAHAGRLAQLSMPTLFVTGEFDANSSPEMSLAMGEEAPAARVEVIPGVRHMMNVTDPEPVNASLRRWLAEPLRN